MESTKDSYYLLEVRYYYGENKHCLFLDEASVVHQYLENRGKMREDLPNAERVKDLIIKKLCVHKLSTPKP
jgi:hypothetical protein